MASAVLQRLASLNRSGRLAKPLQYSQVKSLTAQVGEKPVLQILQELEDQAAQVQDPVEFVRNAASALAGDDGSQSAGTALPPRAAGPGHQSSRGGMIVRRLNALNNSQRLHKPIDLSRVEAPLSSLGMARAMTILQGLEDTAEDIRDPTAYIRTAVLSAGGVVGEEAEPEDEEEVEVDQDEEGEAAELNWYEQAAPGEDGAAEDESMEEVEMEPEQPRKPQRQQAPAAVKQEPVVSQQPLRRVKAENGQGPRNRPWAAKAEELTEAERIERRVDWLNKNAGLAAVIDLHSVLPALDSIGFRQSMRVLRRLEESGASVADPNEFIRDLVGRAGWIWAKPDVIDEDTRVAKRVAWMNQFGCLSQPIEWAEVADVLDGLKVPHAMVLLRELEMQGKKVSDPTAYIKRTAELAGGDDIQLPGLEGEDSVVSRRIDELNSGGTLAAPIDATSLGEGLARLGEEEALQLLQEVADKGSSVKDPTGYIRFKLKARLASKGMSLEAPADDGTKILKRIEWLNDYGGLLQDIDYNKVSPALEKVGVDHAMTVLKELEDQRQGVQDPTMFILDSLRSSRKRAVSGKLAARAPQGSPAAGASARVAAPSPLQALNEFMAFLNRGPGKRKVKLSEVADALDALGTQRAMRVLKEMKEKGLGLDDPVSYIKAAAQRHGLGAVKTEDGEHGQREDMDDVAKLTSRLKWLNQFAGLAQQINADEVIGALYCLGVPQSMSILRGLQERGSGVPDPTRYIKQAVQHANRSNVLGEVKDEEEAEEEEEEDQADAQEEYDEDEFAAFEDDAAEEEEAEEEQQEEEAEPTIADEDWAEVEEEQDGWAAWDGGEELDAGMEEEEEEPSGPAQKKARTGSATAASAAAAAAAAAGRLAAAKQAEKKKNAPRRVVGAVTGFRQMVPSRATPKGSYAGRVKQEPSANDDDETEQAATADTSKSSMPDGALPITPQEKMIQVRNYALKHKLYLDDHCLKGMARLPFYRAKDMIEEVLLGGKQRRGVTNPSRYLSLAVQKMSVGLGVEQGIAMELAVSLGVVLNNDALDELAAIPRKESHNIIRELSKNPVVRSDPLAYIRAEVLKCRANMDARPFPSHS